MGTVARGTQNIHLSFRTLRKNPRFGVVQIVLKPNLFAPFFDAREEVKSASEPVYRHHKQEDELVDHESGEFNLELVLNSGDQTTQPHHSREFDQFDELEGAEESPSCLFGFAFSGAAFDATCAAAAAGRTLDGSDNELNRKTGRGEPTVNPVSVPVSAATTNMSKSLLIERKRHLERKSTVNHPLR